MAEASPSPLPPQTGADYNVERPSFLRRFTERVGGGVISGIIAGGIRVGAMGLMIGTALAMAGGILGASTFMLGISTMAVPMMIAGAVVGALFVGGANLITGLFGATKDAVFNPNKGAEITQTPEQAKGKGQGTDLEKPSQAAPGIADNAITQADPNKPAPRRYGPENAQYGAARDGNGYRPARPNGGNSGEQQSWENRNRIGFRQNNEQGTDGQQPTNAEQTQQRRPMGFQKQSAEAHTPRTWVDKTGTGTQAARGEQGWTDHVAQQSSPGVDGQSR